MNLSQCGNWRLRSVAMGQLRPNLPIPAMSVYPPIASGVTTANFSREDAIPSEVGYAFNCEQFESCAKLRSVSTASICIAKKCLHKSRSAIV